MYIQFSSQLALHIRKCSRVFYLKMVNDVQNLKLCVFAGHILQALTSFFFCYTYAAPSQQILLPLYSCENSSWTLLHWNVGVLISLTSCVLILLDFNAGGVLWAVVLFRCYLVAITQLLDVRCVFLLLVTMMTWCLIQCLLLLNILLSPVQRSNLLYNGINETTRVPLCPDRARNATFSPLNELVCTTMIVLAKAATQFQNNARNIRHHPCPLAHRLSWKTHKPKQALVKINSLHSW